MLPLTLTCVALTLTCVVRHSMYTTNVLFCNHINLLLKQYISEIIKCIAERMTNPILKVINQIHRNAALKQSVVLFRVLESLEPTESLWVCWID